MPTTATTFPRKKNIFQCEQIVLKLVCFNVIAITGKPPTLTMRYARDVQLEYMGYRHTNRTSKLSA